MPKPLVTVICLCYNHEKYVEEAIQSVLDQSYENVELIVIDDASEDKSKAVIEEKLLNHREVVFIRLNKNQGNCKAFNVGLKKANGKFIIDLAADDLLLPNRIESGIKIFSEKNIGVEFCNVENISDSGELLNTHFEFSPPQGDVYATLIEKYFISPPGMMIRKDVLDELNGYDENLYYEDFDFWIRSSRKYKYGYNEKVLVKKRFIPDSLSKKQFTVRSAHQRSTLKVCKKIFHLNNLKIEDEALAKRIRYEIKMAFRQMNIELIPAYLSLYFKTKIRSLPK